MINGSAAVRTKKNRFPVRLTAVLVALAFLTGMVPVHAWADDGCEQTEITAAETVSEDAETAAENQPEDTEDASQTGSEAAETPADGETADTAEAPSDSCPDDGMPEEEIQADASADDPQVPAAEGADGDPAAGGEVTAADIELTITGSSDAAADDPVRCHTWREFTFYNKNDENKTTYTCYVYGDGVTDEMCGNFAAAFLNTGSGHQNITDSSFTDCNKSSVNQDYNGGYDSNHCWLKAASNTLYSTGWLQYADAGIFNVDGSAAAYFTTEDDIGDYVSYCFVDDGGFEQNLYDWLFTGDAGILSEFLKYGADGTNDALLYSYAQTDIYDDLLLIYSDSPTISDILSMIEEYHAAADLGIYFYHPGEYEDSLGGHAITLTGFITDAENNPVGVIITDPDDSVKTGSDDAAMKDKIYSVNNLLPTVLDNIYNMQSYYNRPTLETLVFDIPVILPSDQFTEVNDSLTPEATGAVKTALSTESSYDIYDSLAISLNYDFLDYYDIVDLKYDLYDGNGNKVSADGSKFSYSKSLWQSLQDSAEDFLLDFTDIIDSIGTGSYELKLSIDPDCFYGNYGWFAQKYNNGGGYLDVLADIWVNLLKRGSEEPEKAEPAADEGYDTSLSYDQMMENLTDQLIGTISVDYPEAGSSAAMMLSGSDGADFAEQGADRAKAEFKNLVLDLVRAHNGDTALQAAFQTAGIAYSNLTTDHISVLLSLTVNSSSAASLTIGGDELGNIGNAKLLVMLTAADGSRSYAGAALNADGTITLDIPEGTESILLVSFAEN